MTKTGILFVGPGFLLAGLLLSTSSFVSLGCGGDGGTGGAGGSSSGDGGTGGSTSSSSGTGGAGGAPGSAYCDAIMANCTGANAQYASKDSCMNVEKALPAGTAADMKGNTMGCRVYHAGAAKADAATHCVHAGPAGGGAAFCGTTCEGFCEIAVDTCKTEWPDMAACMTDCAALPTAVMNYNTGITSGDTIECRLYHLSVAATDAPSAATHCPHSAKVSSQCK